MTEPILFQEPALPVDEELVEYLERLLEEARAGEIYAIAAVTMNARKMFREFTNHAAREHCIPFLAYTRVLQMRLEALIPASEAL